MSAEDLKRLQRQTEANSIAIQKMQLNNKKPPISTNPADFLDDVEEPPYYDPTKGYQPQDPNKLLLNTVVSGAADLATKQTIQTMQNQHALKENITKRMQTLVARLPDLQHEDSPLVIECRNRYQQVKANHPGADEATLYELVANEAAAYLGIRPSDAPMDDYSDYTMPSRKRVTASRTKSAEKRLTPKILAFAELVGINTDKENGEGKKNRAELAYNTEIFNADRDESEYHYQNEYVERGGRR